MKTIPTIEIVKQKIKKKPNPHELTNVFLDTLPNGYMQIPIIKPIIPKNNPIQKPNAFLGSI